MKKYLFLLIILLFGTLFLEMFSRDASVYAYMGMSFFEGDVPYVNSWDHKGISLYFINALGYLIGFKSFVGIRVLEIGLITLAFFMIYEALKKTFSEKSVFIATVFGLLSLSYFLEGGNLTEEYGALFVLIALSIILKKETSTLQFMLVGLLLLINVTIRANLISFWLALFATQFVFFILIKKEYKNYFKITLKISIGFFIGVVCLVIYFVITDSFTHFYDAAFLYNLSYAKQTVSQIVLSIIKSIRTYEVSILMILALMISIVKMLRKEGNILSILLFFWIPLELIFSNMSGKHFAHYFIMWVPIIVLATAYSFNYFKLINFHKEKQAVILLVSIFLFFQIPIYNTSKAYKNIFKEKTSLNDEVSTYILKNYAQKSLLVWGNEASIYLTTNKRAPIPYFYQTFLKVENDFSKNKIKDFTEKFISNPPELLVDVKTPSLLFIDESNRSTINKHQKENFNDYFRFLKANYKLSKTLKTVNFYVLKK